MDVWEVETRDRQIHGARETKAARIAPMLEAPRFYRVLAS